MYGALITHPGAGGVLNEGIMKHTLGIGEAVNVGQAEVQQHSKEPLGPLSYHGPVDARYDIGAGEHYMAYRVTDIDGKVVAYVASLADVRIFRVIPELLQATKDILRFAPEYAGNDDLNSALSDLEAAFDKATQ